MGKDEPLKTYGSHFYQGIADGVVDIAELATRAVECLTPDERHALRIYLQDVLDKLTSSELKGKLNRVITDYAFNSKQAVAFLRATAAQLERG